jgi:hypothetical protein
VLENPAQQGRGRLLPRRLFHKSPQSRVIERCASVTDRKITFGNHRCFIYGYKGDTALSCGETVRRLSPSLQNTEVCEVWNMNRWYYHSDSIVNIADSYIHDLCREVLPHGTLWTGACDNAAHRRQRLAVLPLKRLSWPSDLLGPSWPSFPSFTEWMEMLRKGVSPLGRTALEEPTTSGYTRVSRVELRENPALASRIVTNVIVGVRSSTEVPAQYWKYFRYRQNFLILVVTHKLPIGLVRFLIGRWCVAPYSLWLRRKCTLKSYLRKVPSLLVKQARSRLTQYSLYEHPVAAGSCASSESLLSESYSDGSDLLD